MLRVDITLSKDSKVSKKLADALQVELEKRVHRMHSGAIIRVRITTSQTINVTGCTKEEHPVIMKLIENTFNDDEWLPE